MICTDRRLPRLRTGPNTAPGSTVVSVAAPSDEAMKSHAARSAMISDRR
jgi:hypothetical protein